MPPLGAFGQGAREPFRNAEDVRSVSTLSDESKAAGRDKCASPNKRIFLTQRRNT
jgi:hypothetical protein